MPRIDLKSAAGKRRGSFLAQTMVLVVLMALVGTIFLRLTFGRHVAVTRANDSNVKRQLGLAVESRIYSCLETTTYNQPGGDCVIPAACNPAAIDGKSVTVRSLGSAPPNCDPIEITIGD